MAHCVDGWLDRSVCLASCRACGRPPTGSCQGTHVCPAFADCGLGCPPVAPFSPGREAGPCWLASAGDANEAFKSLVDPLAQAAVLGKPLPGATRAMCLGWLACASARARAALCIIRRPYRADRAALTPSLAH